MKTQSKSRLFTKILVPIVHGCDQLSAIAAARAIGGEENVTLVGVIHIPEDESLSTAAMAARQVRKALKELSKVKHIHRSAEVHVSHRPWDELVRVVEKERSNLLVLEYPCQFELLKTTPAEVLMHPPCDIAIVNSHISSTIQEALIPMRGGPYAELALRMGLSLERVSHTKLTSLHLVPVDIAPEKDAAFHGIERILQNMPEVERKQVSTDNPAEAILGASNQYDVVIIGASARSTDQVASIGPVAEKVMAESKKGLIVVKTKRPPRFSPGSEEAGQAAISVLVDKWFAENTFHADEFEDLKSLLDLKNQQHVSISLALPALNEEETVGNVIKTIQKALALDVPLLDEIVLIDSSSSDRTREIAHGFDIPVHVHQSVLQRYGVRDGKGEALWKSLFCTRGDIVIWIDTDIVNIHPRFVYGLIGPLLIRPDIHFVKGFYKRPLKISHKVQAGAGGRVTELTARPLINLFYPELSGVVQPLSGEYGGRRKVLEQLPFFSGYGVEIGLLIDVFEKFGLHAIGQVDLLERIHHNQELEALSKMSFAIIQAVMRKLELRRGQSIIENVNKTMKLIRNEREQLSLDVEEIAEKERPPMLEVEEYRTRFNLPETVRPS
ncbi:MAG TPA: glucosyl-3-phosphoglycerate synthase [Anaerolineales bacterium]|nr:glucosyl-3-phosphoglycerate synthase [Anaerolineales bacterium]